LLGVLGRWDEAKDQFELALSINRSATEQSRPYLLFLSYSGDTSTKLRVAAQCLDQHVDNISAYTGYASALMRSGKDVDLAEAEEALGRALKMDKTSYKVHAALAELRAKQKRIPECEQHLEYLKLVADKLTYRLVQGILKRRLRVD
jgi:tetratricopeptide (TPR) repeat protein